MQADPGALLVAQRHWLQAVGDQPARQRRQHRLRRIDKAARGQPHQLGGKGDDAVDVGCHTQLGHTSR
jgi:hypothetical protein